ncbi:MAG: glycerol-3-phosphate 1-O-acyltransferase PlsY [Betaproteobacteria bacterium]|nr:glycerol-3-phosphate 1-O-acyltransferase PlsY [Betaproteobacteria bacterium]
MMNDALIVLGAYLVGSVSFAVIVSRMYALPDPHSYGSGNPGATNVLRTGHKGAAVLTLIGDTGKGVVAVLLARALSGEAGAYGLVVPLAALAAFVGHLFPVFHGFRGGKGVATAAGVLLALNLWLGLGTLATWLVMAVFFRISSLAALVAALFAPFLSFGLFGLRPVTFCMLPIAALLFLRHKANIARLLAGSEPRIGEKKNDAQAEQRVAQRAENTDTQTERAKQ